MKVTIKDVAKAAQVSVATASMAINNRPGIKKETRDKVVSVAKELHYYPDYSARSLVTRDSNSLGLIIPEIQNPFYSAIVDYMTQLAEERGYQMLLAISNNSSQQEKAYIEMFLSKSVKGIINLPMIANNPEIGHIDMIRNSGVPLVFCTENYGNAKKRQSCAIL
jgi:LacI family transcriptional regulator